MLAASLFLGAAISVWQAIRATSAEAQAVANESRAKAEEQKAVASQQAEAVQRKQAENDFEAVLQTVDELLAQAADDELRDIPRVQLLRRQMMEGALALYARLSGESRGSPTVRLRAARTWSGLAVLCAVDLGDYEAARRAHENALKVLTSLVADAPGQTQFRESLLSAQIKAAWFYSWGLRRHGDSARLFQDAGETLDRLSAELPTRYFVIDRAHINMGLGAALSALAEAGQACTNSPSRKRWTSAARALADS